MKRILFALLLLPTAALAQPAVPTTVIVPVKVVAEIDRYLNTQPRGQVEEFAWALEACVSAQIPDAKGHLVSPQLCPDVMQEQGARQKQIAGLESQIETLKKQVPAKPAAKAAAKATPPNTN